MFTRDVRNFSVLAAALALGACAAEPSDDSSDETTGGGGLSAPPPPIAGTGGSAGSVAPPRAGSAAPVSVPMPAGLGGSGGALAAGTGGSGGAAGSSLAGSGGVGGMAGMAGAMAGAGGMGGGAGMGAGACCADGDCLCHGPDPTALTSDKGPYATDSYTIAGVGCVFYPTDAEPPFAAVSVADGFLGAGGCSSFQTGQWGPLYASHGIVAMIVDTGSSDQPNVRARALADGIDAFKAENMDMSSPLFGKLAGRYGTSGFSMGGGGTTIAAADDPTLLTDVAIMPWGPATSGITVPTLIICGSSDGTAPCASHGTRAYAGIADSVPKMRVQITSGHAGQPSSGGGKSGEYGLAFQKVFLEGDERWRPLLVAADSVETTIH